MKKQIIVDAHLDLAMNAMEWNRDLRQSVSEIRESESHLHDKPDRGKNTVSFDALREGNIGIVVATQIGRFSNVKKKMPGTSWSSPHQAWAQTQGQLAWYRTMENEGILSAITSKSELNDHLKNWESDASNTPIGYIRSLEGADSILSFEHLEIAYSDGLRAIGPAHYGPGIYAQGTDATGGIGEKGKALLREMERLNIILDATHLCDDSFWEALDNFSGPVWASHNNCRALVPHHRQFSDEQLKALIERGAVVGGVFDTWMLSSEWVRGQSTPLGLNITMETVVDHIDHICQLAGNSQHVGIGSDLDGGYGKEQSPADLDTIADLQKIPEILNRRGYSSGDIDNICGQNWIRFLRNTWTD